MKELLLKLNACDPAIKWAEGKSWKEIFEQCPRGDWLLWLFYYTKNESENDFALLTIAKGHCANTVRHLMKDQRSLDAVDAAINYNGDRVVLKKAADAAYAAAADAAYAAAVVAAHAAAVVAAHAAAADDDDAYAAANDAYATYSAAYAAVYAAAYAAEINNQKVTADIVRKYIPIENWHIDINLKWE
jgi:hypothetical protein